MIYDESQGSKSNHFYGLTCEDARSSLDPGGLKYSKCFGLTSDGLDY